MYRTPTQPQNRGQSGRSTSAEQAGSPSRGATGSTTIFDTQLGTQDTIEAGQAIPQAGDESPSDSHQYSPPPAQPTTTRQSHSAPASPSLQFSQNVDVGDRAGRRRRSKGKGKAVQRAPSVASSTDSITALIAQMVEMQAQFQAQMAAQNAKYDALANQMKKQSLHPTIEHDLSSTPQPLPPRQPPAPPRQNDTTPAASSYVSFKVPYLANKLSDGKKPTARLWRKLVSDRISQYEHSFVNDSAKRLFVLDQLEGLALDYCEGLYIQDNITSEQMIDKVANFLTDPAERQRAQDAYAYLVQLEGQPFELFYQQFELLASIAGKVNSKDKHQDLIRKLNDDYRTRLLMSRLGSEDYEADVRVLQHLDADDAGIAASKQARRASAKAVATAISRRDRAATYAKSRQALQGQPGTLVATPPALAGQPTPPANVPRHFSPAQRATPPVQSGGFTRSSPSSAFQARAQTPRHTVGEVEYAPYEDTMRSSWKWIEQKTPPRQRLLPRWLERYEVLGFDKIDRRRLYDNAI